MTTYMELTKDEAVSELVEYMMDYDDMTLEGCLYHIESMRKAVRRGEDPRLILEENGLEMDFIVALI